MEKNRKICFGFARPVSKKKYLRTNTVQNKGNDKVN